MRHGTTNRRQRNRGNNGGRRGNSNRSQVFDSNGPDVRIRGTAHQVAEKYVALAKDASSAGDSILAESYYQYAEHYQRVINDWDEELAGRAPRVDKSSTRTAKSQDSDDDDLSLPASILGEKADVDSKGNLKQESGELEAAT